MAEKFSVSIEKFADKAQARTLAVAQMSIQNVIDDAQLSVAKGGRMRVDTGFLRASGTASLNGMPSGPVRGDSKIPDFYSPDSQSVTLTLAQFKLGQTFWFGWTANYARAREAKDAFLRLAAQRWPEFVASNTRKAKERFK